MKLSIIIPCYNEKQHLSELISLVKGSPVQDKEIILVDDCSTDGTREMIRTRLADQVDKVIYHPENMGKGAAIRSGLNHVTGDMVIIQDADLEYDPMEYPKLMEPVLREKADVVYGSRFMGEGPHRVHLFWHYVGNRILTIFSNMFTNLNLTDMETCYKLFRTEVIRKIDLKQNRFGIEPELTAKIAREKCRIYEVGISYYGRSYQEGKKIGWKDGFKAIFVILRYGIFRKGRGKEREL
ncbi:MAG: glycosyltransferase family 2 protein [Deltaproteobacteria bacterium]|nr:glycosyltransferase family 2 protein [Deltaproteobacteria bacterium]MBW2049474.1 glycosyltransferase family 2 protein [Deltaproteobacteria bacterium]MBW2110909.1 glycosyltransferase family 2 protein [Deltaproteobacteria bacterium]